MGWSISNGSRAPPSCGYTSRALGTKIGKDALIGEIEPGAVDLISIGAGTSIGSNANFANARVEGNELVIGTIEIGANAYIGSSCVIEENVVVGEGAELGDLTAIGAGGRLGAWEVWDGSPGRKVRMVDRAALDGPPPLRDCAAPLMAVMYGVLLLAIPASRPCCRSSRPFGCSTGSTM